MEPRWEFLSKRRLELRISSQGGPGANRVHETHRTNEHRRAHRTDRVQDYQLEMKSVLNGPR